MGFSVELGEVAVPFRCPDCSCEMQGMALHQRWIENAMHYSCGPCYERAEARRKLEQELAECVATQPRPGVTHRTYAAGCMIAVSGSTVAGESGPQPVAVESAESPGSAWERVSIGWDGLAAYQSPPDDCPALDAAVGDAIDSIGAKVGCLREEDWTAPGMWCSDEPDEAYRERVRAALLDSAARAIRERRRMTDAEREAAFRDGVGFARAVARLEDACAPDPLAKTPRVCADCNAPIAPGAGWEHSVWPVGSYTPQSLVTCREERCVATDPLEAWIDNEPLHRLLLIDEYARKGEGEAAALRRSFTPAQRAAVSAHWSAELRTRIAAGKAAERNRVTVDIEED